MLVELRDVVAYYRSPGRAPTKALDKAEIAISGGEIVGLLGDNGAGKTTLMRVMLGLMHAELGYVSVLGLNPAQNRHKLLKQCGAVIDGQRELPPRWTPLDLLRFVGTSYGLTDRAIRERTDDLLERFGLIEVKNNVINSFSRGMKQKLSLILALMHNPKLLVLDEPTIGLDVGATRELLEHIRSAALSGCAVLISSHQLSVVEQIADKIAVIHKGRTVFQDSPEALVRHVGRGTVKLEFAELTACFVGALPSVVHVTGNQVALPLDVEILAVVFGLAQRCNMKLVNIDRPVDFENAYLTLLEERSKDHVHIP